MLPSQLSYSFSSVAKSFESNHSEQNLVGSKSFTVFYLVNSCGMSAEDAKLLSKRFELKDPHKPDSVLKLLSSYGFSDNRISKVVKRRPRVLLAKPEITLLPKLRFLQSIGFSASEIPELLSSNPIFLAHSLEKRIVPHYEGLKSVLGDHGEARRCLKTFSWSVSTKGYCVTNIVPNIKVLRGEGAIQSCVSYLLTGRPAVAFMNQSLFVEYAKFAKEIGIEPFRVKFVEALSIVTQVKSTWESKLVIFERLGWSRDVTLLAFSKFPNIMNLSEKQITNKMKFFCG